MPFIHIGCRPGAAPSTVSGAPGDDDRNDDLEGRERTWKERNTMGILKEDKGMKRGTAGEKGNVEEWPDALKDEAKKQEKRDEKTKASDYERTSGDKMKEKKVAEGYRR